MKRRYLDLERSVKKNRARLKGRNTSFLRKLIQMNMSSSSFNNLAKTKKLNLKRWRKPQGLISKTLKLIRIMTN